MAQRIDALVNVKMSTDEVAETIGCPSSLVLDYGNGYARIADAPKPKKRKTKKKVEAVPVEAPEV